MRLREKETKMRLVYLNDACMDAIKTYLKDRPADGLLTVKHCSSAVRENESAPKRYQAMVNKYLEKIGLGGRAILYISCVILLQR